jgi:hypothetical protein
MNAYNQRYGGQNSSKFIVSDLSKLNDITECTKAT